MPLTVLDLYTQTKDTFLLTLHAGESGLSRRVSWIHTIEDKNTVSFRRSGDLMITTGMAYTGEEWLLQFIRALHGKGCSGLIVNEGKYIKAESISKSVVDLCNSLQFPLLTMPWKIDIADIMQHYSDRLLREAYRDDKITTSLRTLVRKEKGAKEALADLVDAGFQPEIPYNVALANVKLDSQRLRKAYQSMELFEKILEQLSIRAFLYYGEHFLFIFPNLDPAQLHRFRERCEKEQIPLYLGVTVNRLSDLSVSYSYARFANKLMSSELASSLTTRDMNFLSLCFSCRDIELLQEMQRASLGEILRNDEESGSDLLPTLREFIECDGNVQEVARRMYVHRNTVNFRIKKLRELTGSNLTSLEEKMEFKMAFLIQDYLRTFHSE